MTDRTALVAGAGFAGCLAALALAAAGWRVRIVERNARDDPGPAALHAHRFRTPDLDRCAALLGSPSSSLSGILDRRTLLERLRVGVSQVAETAWRCRVGTDEQATLLIDATGTAFGLAEPLHRRYGAVLRSDELADDRVYASWRVPVDRPSVAEGENDRIVFSLPDSEGGVLSVIHRAGDDPAEESAPDRPPDARFGAGSLTRTRIAPEVSAQVPLLLLGDALIRTPPRYGDGLAHACAQAAILAERAAEGADTLRGALDDHAARIWEGVAFTLALDGAAVDPA